MIDHWTWEDRKEYHNIIGEIHEIENANKKEEEKIDLHMTEEEIKDRLDVLYERLTFFDRIGWIITEEELRERTALYKEIEKLEKALN